MQHLTPTLACYNAQDDVLANSFNIYRGVATEPGTSI